MGHHGGVLVAAVGLMLATPASAGPVEISIDGFVLGAGQLGRQTIRISGLAPAVDSVSATTEWFGDYGLDWWEDFGDGFELWGNEYFFSTTLMLDGPGSDLARFDLPGGYGFDFFVSQAKARLRRDGADMVLHLDMRLGRNDQRCGRVPEAMRTDFAVCGLRQFSAFWDTTLILGGPGAAGATWTVTSTSGMIPEPASWALMIAGFGLVGTGLRRQRTKLKASRHGG